jgi:hypothetical protein
MAEPIINLHVNLGNATQEIDRFGQALGRVDQKARGIYATLQDLSARYQSQGFLGAADQRALERGMQSWQRAGERLDLQRRGALTRVQATEGWLQGARALPARNEAEELRRGQLIRQTEGLFRRAQDRLYELQGQHLGRAYLQGELPLGILGNQVPGATTYGGRFTPWQPGMRSPLLSGTTPVYGGRFTPWQPGMQPPPQLLSGATAQYLGRFAPWQPGMTNPNLSGATAQYLGRFTPWQPGMQPPPQLLSGATPQYLGRFAPWQPGMTNPNLSGTTPVYGGSFTPWQPGMTNPNLSGTNPQYLGRFTPWQPGMQGPGGPGGAGQGGGGGGQPSYMLQRLAGMGGRILGLAAGVGAYEVITKGMEEYEQRQLAALRVGSALNEQYAQTERQLSSLRKQYDLLTRDAGPLLATLAYGTGRTDLAGQVAGVAQAYGVPLDRAASAQVALAHLSATRQPNLAHVLAGLPATLPMSHERFLEQVTQIAAVGGVGAIPQSPAAYRRYAEYTMGFGGRYEMNPAAAYAGRAAGLAQASSPTASAVKWQTIARLIRTNPVITLGTGETIDLRTREGQRIALQNPAAIPEMEQGMSDTIDAMSGGNAQLGVALHEEAFGTQGTYAAGREYRGMRRMQRAGGPLPGRIGQPVAPGTEVERRRAGRWRPGMDIIEREAEMVGKVSETTLIKTLEDWRTGLEKGIGQFAETVNETGNVFKAVNEEVGKLPPMLKEFAGAMIMLMAAIYGGPATAAVGAILGGGLAISGLNDELAGQYDPSGTARRPSSPYWPGGGRRMTNPTDWKTQPRRTVP